MDNAPFSPDPPNRPTYPSKIDGKVLTMKDTPSQDYQIALYKPHGQEINGVVTGRLTPIATQDAFAHGPPKDQKWKFVTTLKCGERSLGKWDWGFSIKWEKSGNSWKAKITKDTAIWTKN